MTIKRYDRRILRGLKRKTLHFGKRSIYDIIKDPFLDFGDKLDYIRHHYVYYEGNYEYFHDSNGKSNENKEKLNNLICSIIDKEADPSELKIWNKRIMEWRKNKLTLEKQRQNEILENFNKRVCKHNYELKVNNWFIKRLDSYDYNKLVLIRNYLLANEDYYKDKELENFKYKTLKNFSNNWKNRLQKDLNKNGESNVTTL